MNFILKKFNIIKSKILQSWFLQPTIIIKFFFITFTGCILLHLGILIVEMFSHRPIYFTQYIPWDLLTDYNERVDVGKKMREFGTKYYVIDNKPGQNGYMHVRVFNPKLTGEFGTASAQKAEEVLNTTVIKNSWKTAIFSTVVVITVGVLVAVVKNSG